MTFKITTKEYLRWETENWRGIPPNFNRDANDYRYGQKFINDHRDKGFIHTDPALFYEENPVTCLQIIYEKYIKND